MTLPHLHARRLNFWTPHPEPLHGPPGLLWLKAGERLLGVDPLLGTRRVDQPLAPAPDDRFALFTHPWPQRVIERAEAPPELALRGHEVRVRRGGAEVGRAALPEGFSEASCFWRLGDELAWLLHTPTRGPARTRLAWVDLDTCTVGAPREVDFEVTVAAARGRQLALFDAPRGSVLVHGLAGPVGGVEHAPSAMWGGVALGEGWVAAVAHRAATRPGALAAVGVGELGADGIGAWRRFALRTGGAARLTCVEGALAIHQGSDLTLVAFEDLRAAPPGELRLVIDDVPTWPPADSGERARVTYYGATTGFGFVESPTRGRLRFQSGELAPPAVGSEIVLDAVEGEAVRRWHAPGGESRPLPREARCFVPIEWEVFAERARASGAKAATEALSAPGAPFCTTIWFGAELVDPDIDDAPVEDPDAVQALDGTLEASGDILDLLAEDELDAAVGLVALRPILRCVDGSLRFAMEFHSTSFPGDAARARFTELAERLLDSGWGSNLELEPPPSHPGCFVSVTEERFETTVTALDVD